MAADATTQLIQRINSQLPKNAATVHNNTTNMMSTVLAIVNIYVAFGTKVATSLEAAAAKNATNSPPGSAPGVAAVAVGTVAAGAATGGTGAIVVAFVGLVVSVLTQMLGGSGSTDAQALSELIVLATDTEDGTINNYWHATMLNVGNYWTAVSNDLNNISVQGVNGPLVKGPPPHAADFINHVQQLVANLLDEDNGYWQQPYVQDQLFNTQFQTGEGPGWYGILPQPQPLQSSVSGVEVVPQPSTMLPILMYAIQSYLSIEELANEIDPVQSTFDVFVSEYRSDIAGYATFLYSQYALAVGAVNSSAPQPPSGLIKTDIPSDADIAGLVESVAGLTGSFSPPQPASPEAGDLSPTPAKAGEAWNGVYGVADQFALYPSETVAPSVSVSCIIDVLGNPGDAISVDLAQAHKGFLNPAWVYSWVNLRLTLGVTARWKALYLFRGYDTVWSVLQQLRVLANEAPLPIPQLPDGLLATGDWSVRELCNITKKTEAESSSSLPSVLTSDGKAFSVLHLIQILDEVAKGNWAGPATGNPLSMPASLRDRLAAVAVASWPPG